MAGIGNVQLGVRLTTADVYNQRIATTATSMNSTTAGFVWNPTTREILKKEETDNQTDQNLTFLFEFRALLNSRVQTLITQLSNALASDLDVAINATNPRWAGPAPAGASARPAMQGNSTNVLQDAGAGRVAFNYMRSWFQNVTENVPDAIDNYNAGGRIGPNEAYDADFTDVGGALSVQGTSTITTLQGSGVADVLDAQNLRLGNASFTFRNSDAGPQNVLKDGFAGPLGADAAAAGAKNLFQKVLFDAVSSVEFRPVLSSGLFKNLVVSASSSLPTGSQLQASFNLNYQGSQEGGFLTMGMDKMTAFYHS